MSKEQVKAKVWDVEHLIGLDQDKIAIYELMSSHRMHPVILLEGRQGLGKRHLAVWMTARLLCDLPRGKGHSISPCGKCASCKEVLSEIHPDVKILDEASGPIRTADAELFQEHFTVMSSSGVRVGIIMNADKMTVEASNRLLKTLEEPASQAIIILTSSCPLALPPTVLGRCLRWRVQMSSRQEIKDWTKQLLKQSGYDKHTDVDLDEFIKRLSFSPGRISRAIEQRESLTDGIASNVRNFIHAYNPRDVLQTAAYLARTKKVKLVDVLNEVELELSSHYRKKFSQDLSAIDEKSKMFLAIKNRRETLSVTRKQAVVGKTALNSQLVMESLGLGKWKEGIK
jgi:DNA polymerase III delta prime subunit